MAPFAGCAKEDRIFVSWQDHREDRAAGKEQRKASLFEEENPALRKNSAEQEIFMKMKFTNWIKLR